MNFNKLRKLLSTLLVICMVCSVSAPSFADSTVAGNQSQATIRIEQVEATDLSEKVVNFDSSKEITAMELLKKEANVTGKDYIKTINDYPLTNSEIYWMYRVNGKIPGSKLVTEYVVKPNDYIEFYSIVYNEDVQGKYSFFEKNTYKANVNQPLTVNLQQDNNIMDTGKDEVEGDLVVDAGPVQGAELLVSEVNANKAIKDTGIITDADGNAQLTLKKAGSYVISAKKINSKAGKNEISRPYATITVEGSSEQTPKEELEDAIAEISDINLVYGKDIDATDAIESILAEKKHDDVKVRFISATNEGDDKTVYIGEDGKIQNWYSDFDSNFVSAKVNVTYEFSLKNEKKEAVKTLVVPFDEEKVIQEIKTKDAELLTADTIKGENVDLENVKHDLILPKEIGKKVSWITWSSDSNLIDIKDTQNGYVGKVSVPVADTQANLTATLSFKKSTDGNILKTTKVFPITIKAVDNDQAEKIKAELNKLMDQCFAIERFKYTAIRDPRIDFQKDYKENKIRHNFTVPGFKDLPNDVTDMRESTNEEVLYFIDRDSTITPGKKVRGYVAQVIRPNIGMDKQNVDVIITLTKNGVSVKRAIPFTIIPLDQKEIDAEVALMEQVKDQFWDGINNGNNTDKNNVKKDLHSIWDVYKNDEGKLVWAYVENDCSYAGIKPDDLHPNPNDPYHLPDNYEFNPTGYFSDVTLKLEKKPQFNTKVNFKTCLTSRLFGKYAEIYPENKDLQKLYRNPLSFDLIVKSESGLDEEKDENQIKLNKYLEEKYTDNTAIVDYATGNTLDLKALTNTKIKLKKEEYNSKYKSKWTCVPKTSQVDLFSDSGYIHQGEEDQDVTITITLTDKKNSKITASKDFKVTVKKYTDEEKGNITGELKKILDDTALVYAEGEDENNVKSNVGITTGKPQDNAKQYDFSYNWKFNGIGASLKNTSKIEIKRPDLGESDSIITATLEVQHKYMPSVKDVRSFTFIIKALNSSDIELENSNIITVKEHIFDGIKGDNQSEDAITKNLKNIISAKVLSDGTIRWNDTSYKKEDDNVAIEWVSSSDPSYIPVKNTASWKYDAFKLLKRPEQSQDDKVVVLKGVLKSCAYPDKITPVDFSIDLTIKSKN